MTTCYTKKGGIMKRIVAIILSFSMVFCLYGCSVEDSSFFYTELEEADGLLIGINKAANCCFVSAYPFDTYQESYSVTIPDTYNNIPITRIGGYYGRGLPCPFRFEISESHMNAPDDSRYSMTFSGDIHEFNITEPYTVEDVVFYLQIGENIHEIVFVVMNEYYPHINADGSITFYHPVVYITCSEENKHFYSIDGKLYSKDNDQLITDFDYAE